jgi:RNA polymerase sigma-70 factor (ECF subfamily)
MDQSLHARFEAVAIPHMDVVYRMARALARDAAEAEDLVQETYIRAFRSFDGFELRKYGAKPWLFKILHNVFYSLKGKQRRERSVLEDVDFDRFENEQDTKNTKPPTAADVDWDHVDEELKAAVAELQPEYRTALLLWSIEGLSYKEIAEVCDCALGTVMSRLHRARQLLRLRLQEYALERKLSTERSS